MGNYIVFKSIVIQVMKNSSTEHVTLEKSTEHDTLEKSNALMASAFISTLITHPFDVLKVRKQVNTYPTYNNITVNTENQYYKNLVSKIRSVYSGLGYNMISKPVFWGVLFTINSKVKFSENYYLNTYIISNITSLILNPIFVLKTLREAESKKPLTVIVKTYDHLTKKNKYNIGNVFSGYGVTMLKNTKLTFELSIINKLNEKYSLDAGTSAFIVKTFTNIVSYPCDTIASRNRVGGHMKRLTLLTAYSGFSYWTIYSALNFSLMFYLADILIYFANKHSK